MGFWLLSVYRSKAIVSQRQNGEVPTPRWAAASSGGVQVSQGLVRERGKSRAGDWKANWRTLHCSVVVNRKLSVKVKLSIYWSIYVCYTQLWYWAVGSDRKNTIRGSSSRTEFSLGLTLRDVVGAPVTAAVEPHGLDPDKQLKNDRKTDGYQQLFV